MGKDELKKMVDKKRLTILETSDVHGYVYPLNYGTNQKSDVGLGKVATLIDKERENNDEILLIDNGDVIQGTPLTYHYARFNHQAPNPMILLLNELEYDCAIPGNHEFNYGLNVLDQAVKESHFPWLSANLIHSETTKPYFGKPYLIKKLKDGVRVGILGLTTHYIPNWEKEENIKSIVFKDALETAKEWVPWLRSQVDVLIVSYHGGLERDIETGKQTEELTGENQGYRMCMEVPGIDVLLTGHQHRSIEGQTLNGVVVLQPSTQGMALGKVTLSLIKEEDCWRISHHQSELVSAKGIPANQSLLNKVKQYEELTQAWLDQPIGEIDGDMQVHDPMEIRTKDNALIEFFNKIQMDIAGVDISCTALFDNKSPGLAKHVTMRDVVANYIYPNTLRVIRVTGHDIKEALERSASYFATYNGHTIEVNHSFVDPKPQHYNYDMWEGISYVINISKPMGKRVQELTYKGEPLAMDEEYDVVMNNYRAGGGGDYIMFKGKSVIKDIPIDVSEIIANYILERGTIKATLNHNWIVTHD